MNPHIMKNYWRYRRLRKPIRAIRFSIKYELRFQDRRFDLELLFDFKSLLEVELLFDLELLLEVELLI